MLGYLSIVLPGRNNVREPLPAPQMRLVRGTGRIVTVDMTEGQLLAVIRHATDALDGMRARRGATEPKETTDA